MADPVLAGDEDHARWTDTKDMARIMAGTAEDRLISIAAPICRRLEFLAEVFGEDDALGAAGRHHLHLAASRILAAYLLDTRAFALQSLARGVAHVDGEMHMAEIGRAHV